MAHGVIGLSMEGENMTETSPDWFNNHIAEWTDEGWDTAEIRQYLEANDSAATEALCALNILSKRQNH